jgi:ubiquinone biosynthesis protein
MNWYRRNRAVRALRAGLTILAAVLRYLLLRIRRHLPGLRPTERSWERAHARTGRAIHRLATRWGGAFVKVGQVLGARADVMPPALIGPLRGIHDRMPPRPFAPLRGYLARELGRPLDEIFASIDERALAAASLAQVHRARLVGGDDVVIKIQYPEARRLFPVDLKSLRRAVRVARWLARVDLRPLADELATQVLLELDFAREATSTERVRVAFAADLDVIVPRIHRELSTDRVLVLEFIAGTPLTELDALRAAGTDLRAVAHALASIYVRMIFEHGFFHGDPHPGNLLVAPDGRRLALLDFGLSKELPAGFGDAVATMLIRGLGGDLDGALTAARSIGFDIAGDAASFRVLLQLLTGDRGAGRGALEVLRATSMRGIPSDFAIIARAFVLLNGLSHALVPGERVIAGAMLALLAPRIARASVAS